MRGCTGVYAHAGVENRNLSVKTSVTLTNAHTEHRAVKRPLYGRHVDWASNTRFRAAAMLLLPLLGLLALPLCLAAVSREQAHSELVKLANANNGIIKIDTHSFELLTREDRDWSATVVFTAMDPRRKCTPCK